MSQKPNHDAKNIGARFRSARSLVPNLNRKSFCERYGINRYTMQSWENGLHVSKGKNVEKFIEALAREGVLCTSEWLIDGTGEPPQPQKGANGNHEPAIIEPAITEPEEKFHHGIEALKASYVKNADDLAITIINDDAMAPKFLRGDTVMGVSAKDKDRVHQKYCIVELTPERRVVRKILVSKENLILVALDDRVPTMTLSQNVTVYGIVWHLLQQYSA